jgi:hypothetical protein
MSVTRTALISLLSFLLLVVLPLSLPAQTDSPSRSDSQPAAIATETVSFIKEFPGSDPAYYSITLQANGDAQYRTAPGEKPVEFHVSDSSTQQIFSLAHKLSLFKGVQLESGRKVAQMGKKTFAYENGGERAEISFNHTENLDGAALLALFERLSTTMQHRDRLEYLMRFDRLGVVKELLQLEVDLDGGRLLEPAVLTPLLEKVRTNKALVNVAQERATGILAKLQATSSPAVGTQP